MSNLLLSAVTVLVMSLGALGTTPQTVAAPVQEIEEPNTLQEILDQNSMEALKSRYDRYSYTTDYISADGSRERYIIYFSDKRYATISTNEILIDDNGEVYGYQRFLNGMYRYLFIDNYEEFVEKIEIQDAFTYFEGEKIMSVYEKDGFWIIETDLPREKDLSRGYENYGYTANTLDTIRQVYTVDPRAMDILNLKAYAVKGDKKTLYYDQTLTVNCDEYIPDQKIIDGVFGEDYRTVNLITDAGTVNEKVYTQTVTKGNSFKVFFGDAFEEALYLDPACTVSLKSVDKNADILLYVKRNK